MIVAMTERGLPIVDGASACPFVAFEDDRDERSTRPDHRHRCYAEIRPASRALVHQDAYCLSPAFPACPTFQDWARREAARARVGPPVEPAPEPADIPPARPRQRDWAAPPPWLGEPPGGVARPEPSQAEAVRPGSPRLEPSTSGSSWSAGSDADAPAFLAERDRSRVADRQVSTVKPTADAGFAAPGTGPAVTGVGLAATRVGLVAAGTYDDRWADEPTDEAEPDGYSEDTDPAPAAASGRSRPPSGHRPSVSESRRSGRSLGGPSWERPRRFEAYPTLKTRIGLPGVPRVAVAFAALVVAALLLFSIPLLLIRPGGGADTGTQSTSTPPLEPSASLAPTPVPSPTPQVYAIASGDTLSKVAKRFGVTIEELLAANPSITNPDKISIGQEIVIPVPPPSEVVDGGSLDGSLAPSASP